MKQDGVCSSHETLCAILTQFNLDAKAMRDEFRESRNEMRELRGFMGKRVEEIQEQVTAISKSSDKMGVYLQGIERELLGHLTLVADVVQTDLSEHKERSDAMFATLQQAAAEAQEAVASSVENMSSDLVVKMSEQNTELVKSILESGTQRETSKHGVWSALGTALISAIVTLTTLFVTGKID